MVCFDTEFTGDADVRVYYSRWIGRSTRTDVWQLTYLGSWRWLFLQLPLQWRDLAVA
jgi:hypothetical protein